MQVRGQDSGRVRRLEHHGASAVAEQDTGAAISPINDPGKGLRADDQRTLRCAGLDEFLGHGQRVNETRTHSLNVESGATVDIQTLLQQACGTGEDLVRCRGRQHDQVDILRGSARGLYRPARRLLGEITGRLPVDRDMPFHDAGALADPLVAGFDHGLQILIGEHLVRQVAAGSGNACKPFHALADISSCWPTRSSIRCATSARTSFLAIAMAFSNARTSAPPWLLTTMPRRPSRLAPL